MLVIELRERGEPVIIGEQGITVQVVDVRGGKVRLGIVAPKEVKVLRKSLIGRLRSNQSTQREGT